jgi:DNA (cytosine-5)-methyltransferase 1
MQHESHLARLYLSREALTPDQRIEDGTVSVPVIDIFAGPGGLGEGFAATENARGRAAFRIALSVEKDEVAYQTLRLRAFYRRFASGDVPEDYYRAIRGELDPRELFARHAPPEWDLRGEAWRAELGVENPEAVRRRVVSALAGAERWVLVGGPPCQAYSLVGRSRNKGVRGYEPANDHRQRLYVEYLKLLADHAPPVFVMENVKGLLSASLDSQRLFERICEDLLRPSRALGGAAPGSMRHRRDPRYRLLALGTQESLFNQSPRDFVVRAERYGIPQARHRVIIIGVREDLAVNRVPTLDEQAEVPLRSVIGDLPRLRSGVSSEDGPDRWLRLLRSAVTSDWSRELRETARDVREAVVRATRELRAPRRDRGSEFELCDRRPSHSPEWFTDSRLLGVPNHSTRGHMPEDLHRYLFAAAFATVRGHSPSLRHFPDSLLPDHRNVNWAIREGAFADRFKVQVADRPASTITSHISKDGHYYIHPDPTQCRSLTVREAARIQTFPDNYFFCGPRTEQYRQVGNAVPPLLAKQLASQVLKLL